jgi:hypothetical protein
MPCACDVCRVFAGKVRDFFMQPVTVRGFAADLATLVKSPAILVMIAGVHALWAAAWVAVVAVWVAAIAHVPSLVFAGLGIWALANARFFAAIFALLCAFAYTKWLWGFIPV